VYIVLKYLAKVATPFILFTYVSGGQTTARGPNPPAKSFHPARQHRSVYAMWRTSIG